MAATEFEQFAVGGGERFAEFGNFPVVAVAQVGELGCERSHDVAGRILTRRHRRPPGDGVLLAAELFDAGPQIGMAIEEVL